MSAAPKARAPHERSIEPVHRTLDTVRDNLTQAQGGAPPRENQQEQIRQLTRELDAMVVARTPFVPGSVVRARPIGVLNLEDEHGGDEKLICVPVDSTFPYYTDVGERHDLPSIVLQQIEPFFTHY